MKNTEIDLKYAMILKAKIAELFDENNESDLHIDVKEFEKDDNVTHFIHALANVMPCSIYNKLTGDKKNMLDFNHIANHLCFQYSKKSEK